MQSNLYVIMEDVLTRKRKKQISLNVENFEPTPSSRLHSVEEFMTKLEQAVLERL